MLGVLTYLVHHGGNRLVPKEGVDPTRVDAAVHQPLQNLERDEEQ